MVKNIAVYNKNKLIVSQKATFYYVKIARKKYAALNSNVINDRRKAEEGWGLFFTVVPSEEHEKVNSVEKVSNYSYSSTISDAPDAIEVNNADRYISYEHRGLPLGIDPRVWDLVRYNYYTTDQFGNKGTIGATDIVIVSGHSVANRGTAIGIMVLQDIGELSETFNVPDQQSSYKHLVHLGPSYFTKSVKIADIDGNGTLDIYIKVGIAGGEDVEIKLKDVYIDADGELQSSSGTYNAPTEFDNTLPYMPFRISAEKGMICIRDNQAIIDRDGRPNRTIITNSDRKQLIQEVIPAFTQTVYADMLTKNILTPICLTKTYGKDAGTESVPYVVSSSATTWSPNLGSSTWVPNYSFAWNNQKGAYSDFLQYPTRQPICLLRTLPGSLQEL
jgi:hypothetical protein